MSDMVKFWHHAISIPEVTPVDRIMNAARQLENAIRALPKDASMDTLEAI